MIRINLLRPEKKDIKETPAVVPQPEIEEPKKEKRPAWPNLAILLAIVVIGAIIFLQSKAISKEKKLLAEAQCERSKLQNVLTKLNQLQQYKLLFERKITLIQELKSQQGVAVIIMDELSKNLPEWVWLTEATYDNRKVQIKGKALSNNLIADFISNLENSVKFRNISQFSSTQKTQGADQFLEFSFSADFISPAGVQPPPPKNATGVKPR
jgi:Tfp pilus assembly protein PilN